MVNAAEGGKLRNAVSPRLPAPPAASPPTDREQPDVVFQSVQWDRFFVHRKALIFLFDQQTARKGMPAGPALEFCSETLVFQHPFGLPLTGAAAFRTDKTEMAALHQRAFQVADIGGFEGDPTVKFLVAQFTNGSTADIS